MAEHSSSPKRAPSIQAKRSANLQVLLTRQEAEQMRELAWANRTSVSQLLRWLVVSYLQQNQAPADSQPQAH